MSDKDIAIKRAYVKHSYKGKEWRDKVDHMPDNQIIAVYYSIKNRRTGKQKEKRIKETGQISIFEYLNVSKYDKALFNKEV